MLEIIASYMFLVEIGLCSSKSGIVLKMLVIAMKLSVVDKNTLVPSPLFIIVD